MHFNAQRVKTVGCLPRLAASAAVKVLCRSECVWGSVRLSAVPGQTTDGPPWAVSLCPLTRILSQTALQVTNLDIDRCIGFYNILSVEKESLHPKLGCLSTKPMDCFVGKEHYNCVSNYLCNKSCNCR